MNLDFIRRIDNKPARFLVSGATNTLATWLLYVMLLFIVPANIAFTASYVAGIIMASAMNQKFVFRSERGRTAIAFMSLIYLAQYFAGLCILNFSINELGVPAKFAPLIATAITVPVMYVACDKFFDRNGNKRPET